MSDTDIVRRIPPTPPYVESTPSRPLTPAPVHHAVIQVRGSIPTGARRIEIDANWIRIETSVPCEVKVNDILVYPGDLDGESQIYTGEAVALSEIYQTPMAFEYRGNVKSVEINRRTLTGVNDPDFADLAHLYWSIDKNAKIERGRPFHYVTEQVVLGGWLTTTFVDCIPFYNFFQAPAIQSRIWPVEAELLAVGVQGNVLAGAFRLLDLRLVWTDPVLGTTILREFYRMKPDNVAVGTFLNNRLEFATPRRIPILGMLRNNPLGAWQLRYRLTSNGIVAPDDLLIHSEWRAVG